MDKPAGITSHDVVARARLALGVRAVGHTGTLDPFATGLLVLLVGRATRLARFVEAERKTYLAVARLGVRTETDDRTGAAIGEWRESLGVSEADVRGALREFVGPQRQRPPSYSAKHVGGVRSYRLARRGRAVELPEIEITVHRIDLVSYAPPEVTFRAEVSAGTYLRAVARDLGDRLGVGAHLAELRREAIGALRVADAVPLHEVGPAVVRPAREVLGHLPVVHLDESARTAVLHGRAVASPGESAGGDVALVAAGELIAVAREVDGWLRPAVVLGQP